MLRVFYACHATINPKVQAGEEKLGSIVRFGVATAYYRARADARFILW